LKIARDVSIVACQFLVRPVASFDEFANHARSLLDQAVGADLVLFPELFTVELFTTFPDWQDVPISELTRIHKHGNTNYTEEYRALFESEAKERGQHIAAGSHLEEKDGKYLNVAYLYGPDGLIHTHDKTHIFPAEAEWSTSEGDTIELIELPFAKVGFNVCYEAEIPECSATLTEQGAEIILCPSFTFTEQGFWRVRHSAQARCIENQVYFVHCATGANIPGDGPLPSGWTSSSILGPCDIPWDNPNGVIAEASEPNREMVVRGKVDLDKLHEAREKSVAPTYRDRRRRADLYKKWPSHMSSDA